MSMIDTLVKIEIPTNRKNQAIHTLDMCVNVFNHWYGGAVEYKLLETSFEGKRAKTLDKAKLEAIEIFTSKWKKGTFENYTDPETALNEIIAILDGSKDPKEIIPFDSHVEIII